MSSSPGQSVVFPPKFRPLSLRSGLVERPGLIDRLVTAAGWLVVVSAPPGFGKSTLLAQWAAADPGKFAFVSLEASENDPAELWNCVVSSVRQVVPSFGSSVEPMLRFVDGAAIESLVRRIATEMDQLPEPVVIVLDDYHVISNLACHASVEALTAYPISHVRLALASRADPGIRLGRLRACGQLVEIRGRDLALTPAETEQLLNGSNGLGLSSGELTLLRVRTEGWPAGLQLAALGLRTAKDRRQFLSSFGGSHRHVVDYLTEVVLNSADADVRRFLLETSILSKLCASLCDAVTGREGSDAMLDELDRSNMFLISLDEQRVWYRYHHLFEELLREQLALTMPERITGLHRAASAWFAEAGHLDDAIEQAIAAQELQAAADLVVSGWGSRMASGRLTTVLGWLSALPAGYVTGNASLSFISAWVNGLLGNHAEAGRSVEDMLAARTPGPLPDGSSSVEHAATLFRSVFPWTDVEELSNAAREVRGFRGELRPEFQAVAAFAVGLAEFLSGEYEEALAELERAAELGAAEGVWSVVTDALGFSAQVALMQDRFDDAEALASRAVEQARSNGLLDLPRAGYYLAALGAAVARSGRLEEGDHLLETGIQQFADWAPLLAGHARLMRARVRHGLGDLDGARALLDEARALLAQYTNTGVIGDLVPQVVRALSASHRRGAEPTTLTDRELSVLRLLEQGLSQREIAAELFLSFHTIHSHTKSIYTRLGVSTREQAIARAREQGLL